VLSPAPVAVDVTYYLHNDTEGGCAAEAYTLRLAKPEAGTNCGSTLSGAPNEILIGATGEPCDPSGLAGCGTITFNATEGVPFVLDATKEISGTIMVMSYRGAAENPGGLGAGPTTLVVTLAGDSAGETKEIGTVSVDYTVTPAEQVKKVDFAIQPDAALNLAEFTSLSMGLYNRGVSPLHGFYQTSTGESLLKVPTMQLLP
jgi:hypothetical protein